MNKKTPKQGYKTALNMFLSIHVRSLTCNIRRKENKEVNISISSLRWREYSNGYIEQNMMKKKNEYTFFPYYVHILMLSL